MHTNLHPPGAQAGVRSLPAPADMRDWKDVYGAFIVDVRREAPLYLPSFQCRHGWRGRQHRVIARNVHADIGVTTSDGLASVWLSIRTDREFRRRCEWVYAAEDARAWLLQAAPRFERLLTVLGCQKTTAGADALRDLPAAA